MELTRRGFALGLAGAPFLLKGLPALAATETPPATVYAAGRTALHPFLGIQPISRDKGQVHLISVVHPRAYEYDANPFAQLANAQVARSNIRIAMYGVDRADGHSTLAKAEDAFFADLVPGVYLDVRNRCAEAFGPAVGNCYALQHAAGLTANRNRRGRGRIVLIRASDLPLIASGLDTTDREVPAEMIRTRWFKVGSLDDKRLAVWATHDAPPGLTRGSAFVIYQSQPQPASRIDVIGALAVFEDGYTIRADRRPENSRYHDVGTYHDYAGKVRLAQV